MGSLRSPDNSRCTRHLWRVFAFARNDCGWIADLRHERLDYLFNSWIVRCGNARAVRVGSTNSQPSS